MLGLLREADGPGIKVIHGVIVCGDKAAFYRYDCERRMVLPEPQGLISDLMTESGAARILGVMEDVKRMCGEIIPDPEVLLPYRDTQDSPFRKRKFRGVTF